MVLDDFPAQSKEQAERQTDGQTDRRTDGQTDRGLREMAEGEREGEGERERARHEGGICRFGERYTF